MKKKKLIFYSYDSLKNPWCGGGGAYRDLEVLKYWREHFSSITMVVGWYPGFQSHTIHGVRICALGWGRNRWFSRLSYSILASFHYFLQHGKLVGQTPSIYAPVLTGLIFPSSSYYILHHYVGKNSIKKYGLFGYIAYFSEHLFFRYAKNMIVVNQDVYQRVQGEYKNILLSYNGFSEELINLDTKENVRGPIVFIGRLDIHMKGIDILLKAYRKLVDEMNTSVPKLILAGKASKEMEEDVKFYIQESQLENHVWLKTNISHEEKKQILQNCLFFCSPSRFEGWGIAAVEANAASKAVLVTDVAGFRSSIEKDVTGVFVNPENVYELFDAMILLCRNQEMRERLGSQGRMRAKLFTWENIAQSEYNWIKQRDMLS